MNLVAVKITDAYKLVCLFLNSGDQFWMAMPQTGNSNARTEIQILFS